MNLVNFGDQKNDRQNLGKIKKGQFEVVTVQWSIHVKSCVRFDATRDSVRGYHYFKSMLLI